MQIFTCDKSSVHFVRTLIQNVQRRQFKTDCDLTPIVNFIPVGDLETSFKEAVLKCLRYRSRAYRTVFNSKVLIDSHHELEKLGLATTTRKYVLILSLEDSLDYILHYMCGCDMRAVRTLKDYRLLSKTLLTTYFYSKSLTFNLKEFYGIDPKLDKYLFNLAEENNNDDVQTTISFHKNILTTAHLLITIILRIFRDHGTSKRVLTSISASSCVFTSDDSYDDTITLTNTEEGIEDYILNVGCFKRYSYLQNISFKWAQN